MLEALYQYESVAELARLVQRVEYKPGWGFSVDKAKLWITVRAVDSVTGTPTTIGHTIPIPGHLSDPKRWLLERIFDVERHEAMEFFLIDGAAPFFPEHGEGANAYAVRGAC